MSKSNEIKIFFKMIMSFYFLLLTSCSLAQLNSSRVSENSMDQQSKPFVLLILIDGYRYDYTEIYKPKNLMAFAQEGAGAKALIPVYPSKTFPNHVSILTGLYAENHEIVSNNFMDPSSFKVFKMGEADAARNEKWYRGLPLWLVAEKQGMKSACYFLVSCELAIDGTHASYFEPFNDSVSNTDRVKKVLNWLQLPEDIRPHFLTLYFSTVDSAGHHFGSQSPELKLAIENVDAALGELFTGLSKLNLPLNTIIISDHGMQDIERKNVIFVDESMNLSAFEVFGRGPQMQLYLKKGFQKEEIKKLMAQWKGNKNKDKFNIFTRQTIPKEYHYSRTPKVGDLIFEAKPPYFLTLIQDKKMLPNTIMGNHGYDPREKNMWGIFYAQGPAFRQGVTLEPMENINLYPMVLKILKLQSLNAVDGKDVVTWPLLK